MDPSRMTNVARRQKGKPDKLKWQCPYTIAKYNLHMIGVDTYDKIGVRPKVTFWYYHRIVLNLMDSVVVNSYIIYKKGLNGKTSLLEFKIILTDTLIENFSSKKSKSISQEPHFALELLQLCSGPEHNAHFTEKNRRDIYCFKTGKKYTKCFVYLNSSNAL